MKEYTLSQQCAILGLDGQDSLHFTNAKSTALRAVAAGRVLEQLLEEKICSGTDALGAELERIRKLQRAELAAIEREIVFSLEADGALEEIPDLLGCDINYYTAEVTMKAYRSRQDIYTGIREWLRAEALEEGAISEDAFCLLWLCRENGCLHEFFSYAEQDELQSRIIGLTAGSDFYRMIWEQEFHRPSENFVKEFVRKKHDFFKNPYLQGVNCIFPFLDRRQAIFIDFAVLGTTVADRRAAIMAHLQKFGHSVEEVKYGSETLLKIDNANYRVVPGVMTAYHIPIQGARLVPVYF